MFQKYAKHAAVCLDFLLVAHHADLVVCKAARTWAASARMSSLVAPKIWSRSVCIISSVTPDRYAFWSSAALHRLRCSVGVQVAADGSDNIFGHVTLIRVKGLQISRDALINFRVSFKFGSR